VIDSVGAGDEALIDMRGNGWVVEAAACCAEAVDQCPFAPGQEQPAIAIVKVVVGDCAFHTRPRITGDDAIGRRCNLDRIVRLLRIELKRRVDRRLVKNLMRFEVEPSVEILAVRDHRPEGLAVFVDSPQARGDESQTAMFV
jgi:hypothetical protein